MPKIPVKKKKIIKKKKSAKKEFKSPVYNVLCVHFSKVEANDYNPNKVAPPEMELLEISIWEDGYTQPIVTYYNPQTDMYTVVDGFHRFLILQTSKRIRKREKEMLPIVVIDKEIGERIASTIRHNRARGTHNIELMSTIVAELVEMGKGDRWICKHLGMSIDELLRLKQITGLASLFQNEDFSKSWEAVPDSEVFAKKKKGAKKKRPPNADGHVKKKTVKKKTVKNRGNRR